MRTYRLVLIGALFLLATSIVAGFFYFQPFSQSARAEHATSYEEDTYVRFTMEAYDSIRQNFWMERDKLDLNEFFRLSVEKSTNAPATLSTSTRAGVSEMLSHAFSAATSTDVKKQLAVGIVQVVLYNLQPVGRSGLLSSQQVTELRQNVSNINPAKDLYEDIGVTHGASVADIEKSYKQESAKLAVSDTPEDKAKLAKMDYAHEVLTDTNNKTLYDTQKVEPTISKNIIGKTLYIDLKQISPTSLQEFFYAIDNATTTPGLDSMIIDLRSNIGGSLDFFQHFFGFFIGEQQYAFDLYHQGEYQSQRTMQPRIPQLDRYKDVAILTDEMTQSTAELTAAVFKHFNRATVIGTTTRGWGTVENTYPLETRLDDTTEYALLLVHSITLRDDNQPIETRGVDPDIRTSDPEWRKQLSERFRSTSLIHAIREVIAKPLK